MKITKKAFMGDMAINMIAATIPVAVLNIVIYPSLAVTLSTDEYGTLTTCIGLVNFVNGIWGSSIAFTRLLDKKENIKVKNYSVLLVLYIVLAMVMNIVMMLLTGCFMKNSNPLLLSICVILLIINNYLIVEYRLILSYKRILISNLFGALGYICGLLFLSLIRTNRWEWVFVFGYGFAVIYNLVTTQIWKSKLEIDSDFPKVFKETGVLVVTSSISGASTYLDKLIIFPVLGATSMAYYQTASIISKVIPMFASAISNVLLSYLVKLKSLSYKTYSLFICFLVVFSILGLVACNTIVPLVINFLYPSYYEYCLAIIPYANIVAILQMFYSFVFPLTLRFCEKKMQYYVQLGRLVPYLFLTIILIKKFELSGFCIATIIAQIIQILIIISSTYRAIRSKSDECC